MVARARSCRYQEEESSITGPLFRSLSLSTRLVPPFSSRACFPPREGREWGVRVAESASTEALVEVSGRRASALALRPVFSFRFFSFLLERNDFRNNFENEG